MSELVLVKTFYHKHDAQMALGLLNSNGIDAMISSDDCGKISRDVCNFFKIMKKQILQWLSKKVADVPTYF